MPVISTLDKQRQEGQEFKVILNYVATLGLAWATREPYLKIENRLNKTGRTRRKNNVGPSLVQIVAGSLEFRM